MKSEDVEKNTLQKLMANNLGIIQKYRLMADPMENDICFL